MKPKTLKTVYWVVTVLFALMMLADGIAGVLQQQDGQVAFRQLGYPIYLMIIVGTGKILGAIALVQPVARTLKEWAFAGFTINFIGASASWAFVGTELSFVFIPLIMLAFMFLTYSLWKKVEREGNALRVG